MSVILRIKAFIKAKQTQRNSPVAEMSLLVHLRQLWRNKKWMKLADIELASIPQGTTRAEICLLIAVAHAHLGDREACKNLLSMAYDLDASCTQIFEEIIGFLSTSANNNSLSPPQQGACGTLKVPHVAAVRKRQFSIEVVERTALGPAWAGNTVNTSIFRHHGIVTMGACQYTAFYASETCIRLVKRVLGHSVETFDLIGNYNLKDAHNSISIGYDKNHCLHITYDHHGSRLRYRRGLSPASIREWSPELAMTNQHEEKVTYPTFINPQAGHPLTILYRDGVWNKGCARLKTYDEQTRAWCDHDIPILSGRDEQPWTCNAYWNHPAVGTDGTLHLSYVWRTDSIGENQLVNNVNICYARSKDNGRTWETSLGQPYQLPITPVNTETVLAVSPGSNLMNQCSMALDSHNHPHIAYYANDHQGIPQYFHLWFSDQQWHTQKVSSRESAFNIQGIGTLRLPISRPDIIIDTDDNVHIIFRGDLSGNRMAIHSSVSPEYISHSKNQLELSPLDVGFSEPIIDRSRWINEGILTVFLQHTNQQDGDITTDATYSDAMLLDVKINFSDTLNESNSK